MDPNRQPGYRQRMKSFSGLVAAIVPPSMLIAAARRLLKFAGIGYGGIVAKSGEIDAMATALRHSGFKGDAPMFFDVGANVGEWSLAVLDRWPGANLHLFEPSADHLTEIRNAVSGQSNIVVNDCALGNEAGTAKLYKNEAVTGLASMTKRDLDHLGISMDLVEDIRIDTLDAYCSSQKIDHIDFLKIDVEGHELDVLQGAEAMLDAGSIGAIQFEFGGCNVDTRTYFRDFHKYLGGYGFEFFIIGPGGRLNPIGPYREIMEQFSTTNYVALRKIQ